MFLRSLYIPLRHRFMHESDLPYQIMLNNFEFVKYLYTKDELFRSFIHRLEPQSRYISFNCFAKCDLIRDSVHKMLLYEYAFANVIG